MDFKKSGSSIPYVFHCFNSFLSKDSLLVLFLITRIYIEWLTMMVGWCLENLNGFTVELSCLYRPYVYIF